MATVSFIKGLRANLDSAAIKAGQWLTCTDTRELYLDISDTERIRIGDFQIFATLADLQAHTTPNVSAMYYVENINCLCRWDGSAYQQINRDTGATSINVTGDGNVITGASYDAATRVLTLTRGLTAATPADIVSAVGELTDGENSYSTVKDYVDAKTANIASDAALNEVRASVAAVEADVEALEGLVGSTAVSEQIDAKIESLDLANTYEPIGTAAVEAGKVQDELDAYKESNNAAVKSAADAATAAQSAADKAQGEVDALEIVVAGKADKATTLEGYGITDGMTKTEIEAAIADAAYDETQVKSDIAANAGAIEAEAARAAAAEAGLSGRLETIEVFFESADNSTEVIDTLKEIQDYIASDESGAASMLAAIEANEEAINGVAADVETLEGEVAGKAAQTDLAAAVERIADLEGDAHTHANKAELDLIASGDKAKWDAAVADINTVKADYLTSDDKYDDTVLAGRVAAIEADYLTSDDKYDDTVLAGRVAAIEADYLTSADKYNDAAVVARVKAIEDDYLTAADEAELTAAIEKKANSADVYLKTETYTQAEVNSAISGAIESAMTWGAF